MRNNLHLLTIALVAIFVTQAQAQQLHIAAPKKAGRGAPAAAARPAPAAAARPAPEAPAQATPQRAEKAQPSQQCRQQTRPQRPVRTTRAQQTCPKRCRCSRHRGPANNPNAIPYTGPFVVGSAPFNLPRGGYGYGYRPNPYAYGPNPYAYPQRYGPNLAPAPARPQRVVKKKRSYRPAPPDPQTKINSHLRKALNRYAANNSVGGRLYLPSGKKRYFVRYAGHPTFDDHTISVPAFAQRSGENSEIPVTLKMEIDPEDFSVVDVKLVRSKANLWRTNGVTFL